jgi:hypothetical protein
MAFLVLAIDGATLNGPPEMGNRIRHSSCSGKVND